MSKQVGTNLSSIALLTTAALFLSPAANATRLASSELPARQPIPQPLVHIDGLTSYEADAGRAITLEKLVSTEAGKQAPIKVGLGRTCDDPWWELSGIQWLTCKLK